MTIRTTVRGAVAAAAIILRLSATVAASSNVDPEARFAWAENFGWSNAAHGSGEHRGAVVAETFLAGCLWNENVGWIRLGAGPRDGVHYLNRDGGDAGVNVDPGTGSVSGWAWGENVGWIRFGPMATDPADHARIERGRPGEPLRFAGSAWGENTGWMSLDGILAWDPVFVDAAVLADGRLRFRWAGGAPWTWAVVERWDVRAGDWEAAAPPVAADSAVVDPDPGECGVYRVRFIADPGE